MDDGELLVFLAHPLARGLTYPMRHGQHREAGAADVPLRIHWQGRRSEVRLAFGPLESLALRVSRSGLVKVEETGDGLLRDGLADNVRAVRG